MNFVGKVHFDLDRAVRAAAKTGLIDDRAIAAGLRKIMDAPSFGTGQFAGALAAFIGGFQGYHVEMCGLTVDTAADAFTYTLDVEIFEAWTTRTSTAKAAGSASPSAPRWGRSSCCSTTATRGGLNRSAGKYRPCRVTTRTDMGPFTAKLF